MYFFDKKNEKEMLIRTEPTGHLQIFYEFIFNLFVIFRGILVNMYKSPQPRQKVIRLIKWKWKVVWSRFVASDLSIFCFKLSILQGQADDGQDCSS